MILSFHLAGYPLHAVFGTVEKNKTTDGWILDYGLIDGRLPEEVEPRPDIIGVTQGRVFRMPGSGELRLVVELPEKKQRRGEKHA
jgi:hypothetical protein